MIFSETNRLHLRSLEETDLPRLCSLIGDWDVVKWLSVVPYPYTERDGEWFISSMKEAYKAGKHEFMAICRREDGLFLGGIGLRQSTAPWSNKGDLILGYWLGKEYWHQGIMTEAILMALNMAFSNARTNMVLSFTFPDNIASQGTLRKAGFDYLGVRPRFETNVLRSSPEITYWEMSRDSYAYKGRIEPRSTR